MTDEPLPSTPDLSDEHESAQVLVADWRSYGELECFAGPAQTVTCFEDNSRVKEQLAEPGEGRVLVVDGGGSLQVALLGDLIAASAARNGWSGVVIAGAVRDVEVLRDLPLGVKALGSVPRRSTRRGEGTVGDPVEIGGATIRPGDHVAADASGVLVLPA